MIAPEFTEWPCPAADGASHEEMALLFAGSRGSPLRLLVLPAWFDEANKLRRQTVEVMRRLSLSGIASVMPDLPGCNESEAPLERQTLAGWRAAAAAAAAHFACTHVLTVRAAALIAPDHLPGWSYAPTSGPKVLRAMLRARAIAAKEAGRSEPTDQLQAQARREGIELAGWQLGPELFSALETAEEPAANLLTIDQPMLGGPGLWLRAEPDEAPEQADALAAIVAIGMTGE